MQACVWGPCSTTILERATQDLTQFNLDFLLHPSSVSANSRLLIVVKYSDNPDKNTRYGKDS